MANKPPVKRLGKSSKRSGKPQELSSSVSKTLLIGAGLFFAVIFSAFVIFTNSRTTTSTVIGGPFQMTTHIGAPINEQDLSGKPFLVFFGYTHCPDVCHTTLFEMSEILRALGPNAKINALFVTVDPERDNAEVLKDYLSNFKYIKTEVADFESYKGCAKFSELNSFMLKNGFRICKIFVK